MNILVITNNYPSNSFPNHGAFVYNLMQELAKEHSVTLIAPSKAHYLLKIRRVDYGEERSNVYRPVYFSVTNKKIAFLNLGRLSAKSYKASVVRQIRKLKTRPDVIYCHFLSNAIPVLDYASENRIPLVIASGESSYDSWRSRSNKVQDDVKRLVKHVICVSEQNRTQLIDLGFAPDRMTVIPNAVNYDLFKVIDKNVCKANIGITTDKFVVGFIGHFIHRKGPNRIIEAIKILDDRDIQLICVGGNESDLLENDFTKAFGPVPNYQLPEIFNAFDIFVLPTLHEGHCNVIEEAKAVCLPVVSSKGTSVEEQIDDTVGILVDPLSISEISSAIKRLKGDEEYRQSIIDRLLERRGANALSKRAEKITKVLEEVIKY